MRDREMVAAIVAGDPAGLAAAYDSYAPALHAYCRSMLPEPADAADAVQDTFLIAAAKLAGLRDPDRLRPWLYAVARNECHRRLRARGATVGLDEAGEMTDTAAEAGAGAHPRGVALGVVARDVHEQPALPVAAVALTQARLGPRLEADPRQRLRTFPVLVEGDDVIVRA